MVGGYQLVSLKDYVFNLTDNDSVSVVVNSKDTNTFRNLINISKPIIVQDIIVKYDNTIENFNNILLTKINIVKYFPEIGKTDYDYNIAGILYDFKTIFGSYGLLYITSDDDNIYLNVSRQEDI